MRTPRTTGGPPIHGQGHGCRSLRLILHVCSAARAASGNYGRTARCAPCVTSSHALSASAAVASAATIWFVRHVNARTSSLVRCAMPECALSARSVGSLKHPHARTRDARTRSMCVQHALSLGEHAQTVRCFYLSATAKHMRLGHGNVQIMYLRVYRDSQTDQASAVLSHALHSFVII